MPISFRQDIPKLFISLVLFSLSCRASPPEVIYQQAIEYVFPLEIINRDHQVVAFHSATMINARQAITQCDLFPETIIQLKQHKKTAQAKLLHEDLKRNLCLLAIEGIDNTTPSLADPSTIHIGNKVYAVSNALNMGISISEGIVSAIKNVDDGEIIQHTAAVSPGSEGGALLDEQGKLIGLIRYKKNEGQNVNFSIPLKWINEVPQRANEQRSLRIWKEKASGLTQTSQWGKLAGHARNRLTISKIDAEVWQVLGYAEQKQTNFAEAAAAYEEAIKLDPEDINSLFELGFIKLSLKKPQEALDIAKTLERKEANESMTGLLVYFAESALLHNEAATLAIDKAAQSTPWNEYLQSLVLTNAYQNNDLRRALRASWRLTQINPGNAKNWALLSDTYLRLNKPDKALSIVDKAIKLSPTDGDTLAQRGRVMGAVGRYREAIADLEKAIANNPSSPSYAWSSLGAMQFDVGLFPEAIKSFQEAVRLDSKNHYASSWLITSLRMNGNYAEAKILIEKEKSVQPNSLFLLQESAFISNALIDNEKTIEACEQALKVDARLPRMWEALAETYSRMGKREEVKRAYGQLINLDRELAEQTYKALLLPYEDIR